MTITPEQIADLRPGDVVDLTLREFEGGHVTVRGPLRHLADSGGPALFVSDYCVRDAQSGPVYGDRRSLAVVSRSPRPFYVNHPRTEPVPGDVVRGDDDDRPRPTLLAYTDDGWISARSGMRKAADGHMPARLHLLVDGDTGQIVP